MDTRVNFTLVGLYVVILFVGMVALGLWLSQGRHRKDYNIYQVYFHESVFGLTTQAPVKYNGVVVGYVQTIELDHENLQRVRLLLRIEEDVPVTETTVATLKTQGITGITYVGMKALTPSAPPLKVREDEEYPIIKTTPSFLLELTDTVRHLAANLNKISNRFAEIMSDENQKNLHDSLANIQNVTKVLSDNSKNMDKSLKDIKVVLENTRAASKNFPEISRKANTALDSVDSTLKSIRDAGATVKDTAKDGRVVLHDFRHQTLPNANVLLEDLQHVSSNLRSLSDELKENPSIIIRGKQAREAGPGE